MGEDVALMIEIAFHICSWLLGSMEGIISRDVFILAAPDIPPASTILAFAYLVFSLFCHLSKIWRQLSYVNMQLQR